MGWPACACPSRWVSAVTTKLPRSLADSGPTRLSIATTRSLLRGGSIGSLPVAASLRSCASMPSARSSTTRSVAPWPNSALSGQPPLGEQSRRDVGARVADLRQRPQRGRHAGQPDAAARAEHADDPLEDGGVDREPGGRPPLLGHRDRQRDDVGEVGRVERRGEVEPRQVSGQHPDGGLDAAAARHLEQVGRDGTAGKVEDGDLAADGKLMGRGHGEQRGPARQRAAGHVHPVDPGRQRHGVPALLALEGEPPRLPLPDLPGVLGLPGEQAALLVGAEPLDAQPFGADPGPQRPLALPDREAGQRGGHQAGRDGRRGDERGQPAGGDAGRQRRSAPRPPRRSRASAAC